MQIKMQWDIFSYLLELLGIIKKTRNNKCWKAVEKREHFGFAFCGKIGTATVENSMEGPQKIKNRTVIWSSNSTFKYLTKGNENTNWER